METSSKSFKQDLEEKPELFKLAKKWKLDVSDLKNKWLIKMNIERSRREYL